jgi:uncharacterized coiled-coil protein SlyX
MWILSWLPEIVFHIITLIGFLGLIASFILGFIPFINQYKLPLQLLSILLLVFGVWFEGGMSNEASWQSRVKELEVKIAESEKKSAETNTQIETVYVDRVQVVKEVQYVTQKTIKANASKFDKTCKIDPEVITILNSSARGVKK